MSDSYHVERTGLYIMVLIILLYTCEIDDKVSRIESKLKNIKQIEMIGGNE